MPTPRLYSPFRGTAEKPTHGQLVSLLRGLYGPRIPTYLGSPYESEEMDHAELILHEIAHMTQLGLNPFAYAANMKGTWKLMTDGLKAIAQTEADRHEVHAITIVLLASRVLKLPLTRDRLVEAGRRNSFLLSNRPGVFDDLVRAAENDPAVRRAANQVLGLIDRAWALIVSDPNNPVRRVLKNLRPPPRAKRRARGAAASSRQ